MFIFLMIFLLMVLLYLSVSFRLMLLHPFGLVHYAVRDTFRYFRYHKWNNCSTGKIVAFCGLFGRGKTLSAVHEVCRLYKKYNNKKIYDRDRKKWVMQKVMVLSNVDLLTIPYEKFVSLQQVIDCASYNRAIDLANDTLTVVIVLGDEFSVQLNSRSFKTNIDPLFLNTLLTCRHHHISLYYTSQRFNHVDALLRQVTSYVVDCSKSWRFMVHRYYDAWDMENATSAQLVRPFRHTGWFVFERNYNAYDTLACVDNLSKQVKANDMLSQDEILQNLNLTVNGMDGVTAPSKKYTRTQRKLRK